MNTALKLLQNSKEIGVNMERLLNYMDIVAANIDLTEEAIIDSFANMFEHINKIRQRKDNEYTRNILIKCGIELDNSRMNFSNYANILIMLSRVWNNLSIFDKSAIAIALAGNKEKEILVVLMDNYAAVQKEPTEKNIAAALLNAVCDDIKAKEHLQ